MVDFYKDWYDNLVAHSNEKGLLVEKISDLLKGKAHENCLEIGLGTSAYFSERLSPIFQEYWIIEKNEFNNLLNHNVRFIHEDFEEHLFNRQFDVVLASHVVYYFNNLPEAVRKIVGLLKNDGRAYFVVNGKESDYGPIKSAFSGFIHSPYTYTYDILREELKDLHTREYTTQASLSFTSHDDLYEALRLSFDLYPTEYEMHKDKVIEWLKTNITGDKFFIDQKIIEVIK